jgi:LPS-assembly lipoprotein
MMQFGKQVIRVQCMQAVTVLLMCLLMMGCGFHLRGAYQLPPQMTVVYVDTNNQHSEMVRGLRRALQANGISVVDEKTDSVAVLKIIQERTDKRVLSVDENGRAREYEITYRVSFALNASGIAADEHEVELMRDFLFDPENVLGKSNEEELLLRAMQQDMTRMIMLRLQTIKPVAVEPASATPTP